ncbi:hypothetical protein ACQ4M3_09705 [Leptolyngbya sp. AN03gr2]|uniref:hypothetical protein n=1 Tax=Leptolyngbya sp. AN03gr2 TaxID=3423364 RepID=UPI003D31A366
MFNTKQMQLEVELQKRVKSGEVRDYRIVAECSPDKFVAVVNERTDKSDYIAPATFWRTLCGLSHFNSPTGEDIYCSLEEMIEALVLSKQFETLTRLSTQHGLRGLIQTYLELKDKEDIEVAIAAQVSQDPVAAVQLYDLMSDISDEAWDAGWLIGLEFSLWGCLDEPVPISIGNMRFDREHQEELKELSNRAGGWWIWNQDADDPRFVLSEEWKQIVAER